MQEQIAMKSVHAKVRSDELDSVIHEIITYFQPQRIILFGSYAYGTPKRR